ncbi:MAG: helix-turn-helix transcriptional regulator [Leeuwenhoekiella sp.]
MNVKFGYIEKAREDFLSEIVKPMVTRRKQLGLTQEDLDNKLGVADRLVSKWECGLRTPTSFHLYCWADALGGVICFVPRNQHYLSNAEKLPNAVNDNEENYRPINGELL